MPTPSPRLLAASTLVALAVGLAAYLASPAGTGARQRLGLAPTPPAKAGKVFVAASLSGVHVIDLATGHQLKKIDTGVLPHNMVVSPDGSKVYVTNVGSQSVSEIDTRTLEHVKDILVGEIPDNAPHRKIDPQKLAKATSCVGCHNLTAMGTLPNAIAWAPDNEHLLVNESLTRSVAVLDPESGKTLRHITYDLPTPSSPANMVVNPKNGELWVLHRYQGQSAKEKQARAVGGQTTMASFNHDLPAGQHVSWVTVHSPDMKQELARIKMEWGIPFGAVFSPDDRLLYVAYRSSNQIAVFDTVERRYVKSFRAGVAPTGLALSADGKTLYATCHFSVPAIVQAIDTESGEITVSMGIPPSPSLVKVDPATNHLFVTTTGYNSVLEIDPVEQKIIREFTAGHQPVDLVLTP